MPNGGLVGLVIEITEPVGLPDSAGGDQGQSGHRVATTHRYRLLAISGKEGAGFGELLIGDAIESAHLFPQCFGFGEGFPMIFTRIQPTEKGALILGTVLAIAPPGQPCGGSSLDFFRGGGIVWGQSCARSK